MCQAPDVNQPAYLVALRDDAVPSLEALLREPSVDVYYSQTGERQTLDAQLEYIKSMEFRRSEELEAGLKKVIPPSER